MAAGPTYEPVGTPVTLGANAASTTFSAIPGTYTDLILICNFGSTSSGGAAGVQFNGDTAGNYSGTTMYTGGSTAISQRMTNQTGINIERSVAPTASAIESSFVLQVMNYANATTFKPTISRANSPTGTYKGLEMTINTWRSTAAITSMKVYFMGGEIFVAGTTFCLYGIKAA
jgi:hypothetical protein